MKDASAYLKHIREAIAKIEKYTIAKDLIAQHNLTDDELRRSSGFQHASRI